MLPWSSNILGFGSAAVSANGWRLRVAPVFSVPAAIRLVNTQMFFIISSKHSSLRKILHAVPTASVVFAAGALRVDFLQQYLLPHHISGSGVITPTMTENVHCQHIRKEVYLLTRRNCVSVVWCFLLGDVL